MKFAHISDTHLGQYRSKIDRENDTYDAFSQAIAKSIEEKVDFVILSGDIFDKSKPPNKAIVLLMQQLKLLKQNDMINIKRIFSKFFIILSIKTFYFFLNGS